MSGILGAFGADGITGDVSVPAGRTGCAGAPATLNGGKATGVVSISGAPNGVVTSSNTCIAFARFSPLSTTVVRPVSLLRSNVSPFGKVSTAMLLPPPIPVG